MRTLVTGANGFIGKAVLEELLLRGVDAIGAARSGSALFAHVPSPSLSEEADWTSALRGVDIVVHTAGMAHVVVGPNDGRAHTLHSVNTLGTSCLAQQAAAAGVKRFVFLSSIGVNGNCTTRPFSATDVPLPIEPYAVSKLAAEGLLWKVSERSGMEVVVLRPPLVYGAGAPGNFRRLVGLVMRGLPLPLGSVTNRRSFLSIDNLTDLIVRCTSHQAAAGQVLLAADGEDLSTPEFIRKIADCAGRRAHVFDFPVSLLRIASQSLGKRAVFDRLCGSLQVDITKTRTLLEWDPPFTVEESLRRAVGDADIKSM